MVPAMLSLDFLDDVRRMNKRQVRGGAGGTGHLQAPAEPDPAAPFSSPPQLYYQVLNFGMIVSSALMIWKGLMVVTGSESPIVVVLR